MSALETQIGGSHYKDMAIQPMEFSMANDMDACQHTVIKYVSRFRVKGGVQDLEKAKHVIDMLIEIENKAQASVKAFMDSREETQATQPCDDVNCPSCYPENHVSLAEMLAAAMMAKPKPVAPTEDGAIAKALDTLLKAGIVKAA